MSSRPNASYTLLIVDGAARETARKGAEQRMGTPDGQGYSPTRLRELHARFPDTTCLHELRKLCADPRADDACVLVARLPHRVADETLVEMQSVVNYSEYAHRYGKKVKARSRNVGFLGSTSAPEDPDVNAPAKTAWADLPGCTRVRETLHALLEDGGASEAVAIRYNNVDECGIRWHGDAERSKTLIARFGSNSARHPLFFMWYCNNVPISEPYAIPLAHGEVAIPSFKAVGSDYKRSSIPTLRHATGFLKTDGAVPQVSRKAQKRARESAIG